MPKLPTAEQISQADRRQICIWWYRLPARKFKAVEQEIVALLWQRYVDVGGYPANFSPEKEIPPIKKRGSTMRNSPNAKLPKLFEEEKTKRGGHLTKAAFASLHAERTRGDAENIRKKLDYHLKRKT